MTYFFHVRAKLFRRDLFAVLGRNDYGVDPLHLSVFVFHGHLALPVGTEIIENALFPHFGQPSCEFMGKRDRHRHIFFRFVTGITEHHSLVARAEPVGFVSRDPVFHRIVHAERDIRTLFVNG